MTSQHKKSVTCISLLAELASSSKAVPIPPRSRGDGQNGYHSENGTPNGHPIYNANGTQGWTPNELWPSQANGSTPMSTGIDRNALMNWSGEFCRSDA